MKYTFDVFQCHGITCEHPSGWPIIGGRQLRLEEGQLDVVEPVQKQVVLTVLWHPLDKIFSNVEKGFAVDWQPLLETYQEKVHRKLARHASGMTLTVTNSCNGRGLWQGEVRFRLRKGLLRAGERLVRKEMFLPCPATNRLIIAHGSYLESQEEEFAPLTNRFVQSLRSRQEQGVCEG